MTEQLPSWSEGQVAALALIASSLLGDALPNPFGPILTAIPVISTLALMVAFPLRRDDPRAAGGRRARQLADAVGLDGDQAGHGRVVPDYR